MIIRVLSLIKVKSIKIVSILNIACGFILLCEYIFILGSMLEQISAVDPA